MNNGHSLASKVALVTGASSGIGQATALALAARGASVAVHYNSNQAGAQEAVKAICSQGGKAVAVRGDVKSSSEVTRIVAETVAALGPVDILVNNAGSLVERLRLMELSEARWDEVIALNLTSAYYFCRAVAPSMMERRSGTIINVSSIAGRNGGALGSIHYTTAKGGLIAFTKCLAKEMALYGVRVNAVSPGVIATPFHGRFSTREMMENYNKAIPLGRPGNPEEVGRVIAFLASEEASYVTGETVEINGGFLMD